MWREKIRWSMVLPQLGLFASLYVILILSPFAAQASPLRSTYKIPQNQNNSVLSLGYRDTGLVVGRITQFVKHGILRNDEVTIQMGEIGRAGAGFNQDFVTLPFPFTVASANLFSELNDLNPERSYVFRYTRPLVNFLDNTPFKITAVYPTYPGEDVGKVDLDSEFIEENEPTGSYSYGKQEGRVIRVQRWGSLNSTCTLSLHLKGPRAAKVSTKIVMNVQKIKLNSEAGCRYAESILPFGKIVEVDATQNYNGVFDDTLVAARITIVQ